MTNYQFYDTLMLIFITVFSFIEMSFCLYDHKKDIKKLTAKVVKKINRKKRKTKPKLKLIQGSLAAN